MPFSPFFRFLLLKMLKILKMNISTSVSGVQHPNAGQNLQHAVHEKAHFDIWYFKGGHKSPPKQLKTKTIDSFIECT